MKADTQSSEAWKALESLHCMYEASTTLSFFALLTVLCKAGHNINSCLSEKNLGTSVMRPKRSATQRVKQ